MKELLGFVVLAAALTASAKVVYVTPNGAGNKDGTSWENAFGGTTALADAYASAADGATAALPGEVWMQGGWYTTPSGAVIMKPHVRVYGGFKGDEDSADKADPESNPTIISVSWYAASTDYTKYYHWQDEKNAVAGPIWTYADGVYTYHPIPDGSYRCGSDCGTNPLFTDNGTSADDNVFVGLTVTSCSRSCFHLTGTAAASVRVKRCVFLANSRYSNVVNANVYVSGGTSVLIDDCRFEGCSSPVYCDMNAADVLCVVSNCQFTSCYAKNGLAAGVMTKGSGIAKITKCMFERSWLDANQPGLDIVAGAAQTYVSDCSFVASRAFSNYGTSCVVVGANNVKVDIARCSFIGAKSTISGDAYSAGTCFKDHANVSGCDIIIRDSYFADNVLVAKGVMTDNNGTRSYGCLYGQQGNNKHTFINCTMVSNTVVNETTGPQQHVSMISGGYSKNLDAIVNCVFKDNDSLRVTTEESVTTTNRVAEFDFGGQSGTTIQLQNTVVTHSSSDYVFYAGANPTMRSMCVRGYAGFPVGSKTLLNCDPLLAAAPKRNGNMTAWGLTCDSPCRKIGERVWLGADRVPYRYDPEGDAAKPWCALYFSTRLTDDEAAEIGISLVAQPLPDAFGVAWASGRVAAGPLNAPVSGVIILLR